MKRYSIISLFLFIAIVYWFFIKPRFNTKNAALSAEVTFMTKRDRGAGYLIEVKENTKTKYVSYFFLNDDFDIQVGDSLFKKSNAPLFVKSKKNDTMRLANYQDILIYE